MPDRPHPTARGLLTVVGIGPGGAEHRTLAAVTAIQQASVLVGYGPYVDLVNDLVDRERHTVVRAGMGEEALRAREAVAAAAAGERVALLSSGDAGVYGMAGRTLQLLAEVPPAERPDVRVLPGVTAALAAGALLGAPLGDDFATLSLSDLRTGWDGVERRLRALAGSGLTLALYNARSRGRPWQLGRACELIATGRPTDTVVALVTDAGREGELIERTTLGELDPERVGMRTVVIVAGDSVVEAGPWLVADREAGGTPAG